MSGDYEEGGVRLRMILRDSIYGISRSAILRLARNAGVKEMSGKLHEDVREVIRNYLHSLLKNTVLYMQSAGRKVVRVSDVEAAFRFMGISLMLLNDVKKPEISKTPFRRLVREVAQEFADNLRFSPESFDLIQKYIETYTTAIIQVANKNALHAGRVRIIQSDIKLALFCRNSESGEKGGRSARRPRVRSGDVDQSKE
jgi:histone H3/H4